MCLQANLGQCVTGNMNENRRRGMSHVLQSYLYDVRYLQRYVYVHRSFDSISLKERRGFKYISA